MSWTSGEVINTTTRLRRLSGAIPTSYTIFNMNDTYYAECNIPGGTTYYDDDAATIINNAISALSNGGTIFVRNGTYEINSSLTLNSKIHLVLEWNALIKATSSLDTLIDASDKSYVVIEGGKIDGNGLVTTVIDFTQSSPTVTHNKVSRSIVCGAKDTTDSCLINITGNSGFQLDQPWLDGRVGATGSTDSAHYGIILDSSGGQNTLYLGDINNFFKQACIRLGGGTLVIIGGALEGGNGTAVNIKITSTNSGPSLKVVGTWMESNTDNILIEEGSYSPAYIDIAPSYMSAGGSGYANIRSTTTTNHLEHLRIRGGTWVNTGGTYCLDVTATTAWIDKAAFGQDINLTKFSHYAVFHAAGWGHKFNDNLITTGKIVAAGAEYSSEIDVDNNVVLRWKDTSGTLKNVLKLGNNDETELQMYNGIIYNPKNYDASSVSGLSKVINIKINGTDYYIPAYTEYS